MSKNKIKLGVSGILVNPCGRILLGKRNKRDSAFPGLYCTPGGGVEFGETLHEALIREFEEETGLTIRVDELTSIGEFFRDSEHHTVMPFFRVHVHDACADAEAKPLDGFSELVWWSRTVIDARKAELTPLTWIALQDFLSL